MKNKIIYFDSETIKNTLQELNKGEISSNSNDSTRMELDSSLEVGGKIKIGVPFFERLQFLLSGRISTHYIKTKEKTTTITSTELSEFEKIKNDLCEFQNVKIEDIENSSTFFRVAGGYLKIVQGGVDGVDVQEFKKVIDSFDGYDTYKISSDEYIRFNNKAFVSNYKRNDLLLTNMNIYCVHVGKFKKEQFDYLKQISKMENLITGVDNNLTLADQFPIEENNIEGDVEVCMERSKDKSIKLYDVVYACISFGERNE